MRALPHVLIIGVHLTGALGSAYGLSWALRRTHSLYDWPDARYYSVVVALIVSSLLGLIVAGRAAWRWRRGTASSAPGAPLRFAFCTAVVGAVGYLVFLQPFKGLYFLLYAGCVAGAHALLTLIGSHVVPGHALRKLDAVAFRTCLALFLIEMTLKIAASLLAIPLFAPGNLSVDEYMTRFRRRPGQLHLGFACDERGFNDVLRERGTGDKLVVAVGDSFTFGIVPRPLLYTEVAERATPGLQIYNMGAPAFGPAEYLALLKETSGELRPDAYLVCLFVGNDLDDARRVGNEYALIRSWFDRGSVMLSLIPSRLMKVQDAVPGGAGFGGWYEEGDAFRADPTEAELVARYAWLADPMTEPASMTEERFLLVERDRYTTVCRDPDPELFELLFEALTEMKRFAGSTPLLVVIIPDEFQVEDAVWSRVRTGPDDERALPQRKIAEWLRERDVPHLDLLPVLRAVPPLADGMRHLYHLRDTHWNRRGNDVAGRAVAEFVRTCIK
ncbi:MAG: hypothetical protein CMJ83_16865 [Planctomycetes bacterium]|nr:hypothetical protein [Planctomycetota bacterium]